MTSCYVITECVTSAGVLVTRFVPWPRQPPFTSASDGAGPVTLSPRLMLMTSTAFALMAGMDTIDKTLEKDS